MRDLKIKNSTGITQRAFKETYCMSYSTWLLPLKSIHVLYFIQQSPLMIKILPSSMNRNWERTREI